MAGLFHDCTAIDNLRPMFVAPPFSVKWNSRIGTDFFPLTVRYIWQKGSIAGPLLKMPFMGPFLESLNPKFNQYLAKWNSGPLSCVSIFHKYGRSQFAV